jgi:hypothetical protein
MGILDTVSGLVGKSMFFQCLWLSLIKVPHLRNAALAYLLKRMPKAGAEEIAVVLGESTGLLASAVVAGVGDESVLVQRNVLELLLVHFPVERGVFGKVHLEAVVKGCLGVVLRRDMSLNRRLYAWLEGGGGVSGEVRDVLVSAVKSLFVGTRRDIADIARPYKILISLLDRSEIGSVILEHTFIDVIRSLKASCEGDDLRDEILQAGNMFLEMVDPFVVGRQLYEVLRGEVSAEVLELVMFYVGECKCDDEESRRVHIPILLLTVLQKVPTGVIELKLAEKLFDAADFTCGWMISRRRGLVNIDRDQSPWSGDEALNDLGLDAHAFYNNSSAYFHERRESSSSAFNLMSPDAMSPLGCPGTPSPSFPIGRDALNVMLGHVHAIIVKVCSDIDKESLAVACRLVRGLSLVAGKDGDEWLYAMEKTVLETDDFGIIDVCLSTVFEVVGCIGVDMEEMVGRFVDRLWGFLGDVDGKRAVELIWLFCGVVNPYVVERRIVGLVRGEDGFMNFGAFWRESEGRGAMMFSGALFVMFDTLRSGDRCLRREGREWFRTWVGSRVDVVMPLLSILGDVEMERVVTCVNGDAVNVNFVRLGFNSGQVLYAFECFVALFEQEMEMDELWKSKVGFDVPWIGTDYLVEGGVSYAMLLLFFCLRFVEVDVLDADGESRCVNDVKGIYAVVADLLEMLIVSSGRVDVEWSLGLKCKRVVHQVCVGRLLMCVKCGDGDLSGRILECLKGLVGSMGTNKAENDDWRGFTIEGLTRGPRDVMEREVSEVEPVGESVAPIFVKMIVAGIESRDKKSWIEFLMDVLPHFRGLFKEGVVEIVKCVLCEIGKSGKGELDVLVLVNALEKLLMFGFGIVKDLEVGLKLDGSLSEYTRLVLCDGEFVEAAKILSVCLELLRESVEVLYGLYECLEEGGVKVRIVYRITKLFEEVFGAKPNLLIETVVDVWKPVDRNVLVFLEMIEGCSGMVILGAAFNALRARLPGSSKVRIVRRLRSEELLEFLEWFYMHGVDEMSIAETWGMCIGYLRESFLASAALKFSYLSQLRYGLVVYGLRICICIFDKMSVKDVDKRVRKEAEEVYLKLFDVAAQSFGVSFGESLWRIGGSIEGGDSVLEQDKMMLKVCKR